MTGLISGCSNYASKPDYQRASLAGSASEGEIKPIDQNQRVSGQRSSHEAYEGAGVIILEIWVNAEGKVKTAKVLKSDPPGLYDAAALASAQRATFKPKIVNGVAVEQKGTWRVTFYPKQDEKK